MPRGMEVPFLTYQQFSNLIGSVVPMIVKEQNRDAPDKSSGKRRQHIHIRYDGLGFIPLNELLASEKA